MKTRTAVLLGVGPLILLASAFVVVGIIAQKQAEVSDTRPERASDRQITERAAAIADLEESGLIASHRAKGSAVEVLVDPDRFRRLEFDDKARLTALLSVWHSGSAGMDGGMRVEVLDKYTRKAVASFSPRTGLMVR